MVIGIEASDANRKQKTGTEWYAFDLIRALAILPERTDTLRLYTAEPLEEGLRYLGPAVEEKILRWPPKRLWTQCRLSSEMLVRPPHTLFVPAHVLPLLHPRCTVTTIHDIGFDRFPSLYAKRELLYLRFAVQFALRTGARIIVPTTFVKQEMLDQYHCSPDRLTVVHHGFDARPFQQATADASLLRRHGIRAPYFLFVGRLQEKKNIGRLVESFYRFRQQTKADVQLVLLGMPDYGFSKIEQTIHDLGMNDTVIRPGYTPRHDVLSIFASASVFVFPTLYEGFGFPLLEAQAAGVPVLTSAAEPMHEVAGDGALFVNPFDIDALAGAMERLFFDSNLAHALRRKGNENIQRFSWDQCARKTLSVLRTTW